MSNRDRRGASRKALNLLSVGLFLGLFSPQAMASSSSDQASLLVQPGSLETAQAFAASDMAAAQALFDIPKSRIVREDGENGDLFGASISRSGRHLVIGAPDAFDGEGAAFVSTRSGSGWSKPVEVPLVVEDNENAGSAVAVDGDFMIVGSRGKSEPDRGQGNLRAGVGSVSFLEFTNGTWSLKSSVSPSQPSAGGGFGASVDLLGDVAIVGEPGATEAGSNKVATGAVYISTRDAQGNWRESQRLTAPGAKETRDFFGHAVKLTRIGGRTQALVSALGRDDRGAQSGAVYVFDRPSAGQPFRHVQTLLGSDTAAEDQFGYSLAVRGNRLIVGAPVADIGGNQDAGAAYVFERSSTRWNQQAKLTAETVQARSLFGIGLAIDGERVAVANNVAPKPGGGDFIPAGFHLFERQSNTQNFALLESYEFPREAGGFVAGLLLEGDSLLAGMSQGLGEGTVLSGRVQVVDTSPRPAPVGGPFALAGLGLGMLAIRRRRAQAN